MMARRWSLSFITFFFFFPASHPPNLRMARILPASLLAVLLMTLLAMGELSWKGRGKGGCTRNACK